MSMSIGIVLPSSNEESTFIERSLKSIKSFDVSRSMDLFASKNTIKYYQTMLGDKIIKPYIKNHVDLYHHSVYISASNGHINPDAYECQAKRVYILEKESAIRKVGDLDAKDCPGLESHVFNKLSARTSQGNFYYFPYGYLFRYVGLGHINDFGFRVPDDYMKLADRPDNHKLIITFGGSSTWSMYCLHEEMFQERLQIKLNQWSKENNIGCEYTVLNFGMHGHVVLNEMLTYILFVQQLRPDIVIANNGWNDFIYGMVSDAYLLESQNMTYQYNLESWSHLIHGTNKIPGNHSNIVSKPLNIINSPHTVIKAYVARKLQFHDIVEAAGGTFIWGLQPYVGSKHKQSASEEEYMKPLPKDSPMSTPYSKIASIYDKYLAVELPARVRFANCHAYFKRFDDNETLFGDTIHTVPLGDERISDFYKAFIIKNMYGSAVQYNTIMEVATC